MEQEQLELGASLREKVGKLGLEFLAEILETAVERRPELTEALAELGHVYTQQGRYEEGLGVDRRLVRVYPVNPTVHYNLACSLAILGHKDQALDALEKAVDLGYRDAAFMRKDADLANVREDDRFRRLAEWMETD